MHHYLDDITLFGTTDNYNTEQTENLHIDIAKNAYCASNCCDEYSDSKNVTNVWHF
jgi:hypothetical protein